MSLNASGIFAAFRIAAKPSLLVPRIIVNDIRSLDFIKLRETKGVEGVVIDKDNCITLPGHETVIPQLEKSWTSLKEVFGPENVLVVSNTAGTRDDARFIQAEALSRELGVPVLVHSIKKPGCYPTVARYFINRRKGSEPDVPVVYAPRQNRYPLFTDPPTQPPSPLSKPPSPLPPRLLVIGDRLTTDVVLSHLLSDHPPIQSSSSPSSIVSSTTSPTLPKPQPNLRVDPTIGVLTTKIWEKESLLIRTIRWLEERCLKVIMRMEERRLQKRKAEGGELKGKFPALKDSEGSWSDADYSDVLIRHPQPLRKPFQTSTFRTSSHLPTSSTEAQPSRTKYPFPLAERFRGEVNGWYEGGLGLGFQLPQGIQRFRKLLNRLNGLWNGNGSYDGNRGKGKGKGHGSPGAGGNWGPEMNHRVNH